MLIFKRLLAVLSLLLWATLSVAQSASDATIDPDAWQALVSRAETVLDADRASDDALESMRAEIASYRERFADARDENATRIRTLQSQLDALGPAPEDGEEAPAIAETRAQLQDRLEELRAPSVVAEAAYNEANGLIAEIDARLRSRQTEELFTRDPIPINPALWPDAWRAVVGFVEDTIEETQRALNNEVTRQQAVSSAPIITFLLVLGAFAILRGRALAGRLGDYLRSFGGAGSGVWTFVVSLGRIIIPALGVLLILTALKVTGLTGMRGNAILNAMFHWSLILLAFAWLGERLYDTRDGEGLIPYASHTKAEIRATIWTMALVLVFKDAADLMIGLENMDAAVASVIRLPIVVVGGMVLFRLITISRPDRSEAEAATDSASVEDDDDPDAVSSVRSSLFRIMPPIRTAAQIIAVAAPLAAAAGYMNAAEAALYPMMWTLAILALAAVLQRFIAGIYGYATGQGDGAMDSLFAVLTGFILAAVCLPFIALIWGVRDSDLGELWTRFLQGMTIGGAQISPVDFLTFLLVFVLGYGLTRLFQGAMKSSLLPKTKIDPGGQNAIVSGIGYLGIFLAGLIAVTSAGIDLSSLAIIASALTVGIGFGLQTIVSNFVSGIILLIERPVAEGDWIEVAGTMGIVKDISVRATRIETFDRTDVIVPNSDLISGSVTNYTRTPTGRVIIAVGVAYGSDTKKVEKILLEIAEDHPMVVARPAPFIVFQGFGADALDFEIRVIIRDVGWGLQVRTEINHAIAERFAEEGIEIPFAQRDIWLRNPEALAKDHARPDPGPAPSAGSSSAGSKPEPQWELDAAPDADSGGPDDGPGEAR
ncbi:DUF3772 domain-containing protein [Marinibacterium profundimaris]|uniref:Uncharacterized protein n=1 Tax=Marinibacterium profundimaris TaxID=1679460 RepID=A0A225NI83_9RHOB|nr:DUF3772 domain-containing protein [Marinibacterium profundimaris]OWU67814.1 hypothetical protein ATO3_25635 [Marinibacterium profundimaris]